MKKHIAKTISILSLFVMLSVGAVNVSAGGGCVTCKPTAQSAVWGTQYSTQTPAQDGGGCSTCKPQAQYAVSASAQTTSSVLAQNTTLIDVTPESSAALFWTRLAVFFASLL